MPDQPTTDAVAEADAQLDRAIADMTDRQLVEVLRVGDRYVRAAAYMGERIQEGHGRLRTRLVAEVGYRWPQAAQAVADAHAAADAFVAAVVDGEHHRPDVDEVTVLLAAVPAEVTA